MSELIIHTSDDTFDNDVLKSDKPVLLDFKGHACSNCKEMEARVWSDPEVLKRLKEDYIIIGPLDVLLFK